GFGFSFPVPRLDLVEDVCEDVVIIARGRIVAHGAIDELRAASERRHLDVEVVGAGAAWLAGPRGVTVVDQKGDAIRLLVTTDADLNGLLAAASAAGPVRRF